MYSNGPICPIHQEKQSKNFYISKCHTLQNVKFEMSEYSNTTNMHLENDKNIRCIHSTYYWFLYMLKSLTVAPSSILPEGIKISWVLIFFAEITPYLLRHKSKGLHVTYAQQAHYVKTSPGFESIKTMHIIT